MRVSDHGGRGLGLTAEAGRPSLGSPVQIRQSPEKDSRLVGIEILDASTRLHHDLLDQAETSS